MQVSLAYSLYDHKSRSHVHELCVASVIMASMEPHRRAYSDDLKWRVVYQHLIMGLTYQQIAKNLSVDTSTVWRAVEKFQAEGTVGTKHCKGPHTVNYWPDGRPPSLLIGNRAEINSLLVNYVLSPQPQNVLELVHKLFAKWFNKSLGWFENSLKVCKSVGMPNMSTYTLNSPLIPPRRCEIYCTRNSGDRV